MNIYELHHVQLAMPKDREQEARNFYAKTLGFQEVRKPENLRARGGCWFELGNIKLHLGVQTPFIAATKAHPAFLVRDLDSITKAIVKNGYEITSDLPLEGFRRAYVADPFGNRIELMQRT